MKKSIRCKRMKDFFEDGFEKIEARGMVFDRDRYHVYYEKDFAPGGKMEEFANYSKERFEEEFCVILSFS